MNGFLNFFKKDDYVFGAFLGLAAPAVLLAIIHYATIYFNRIFDAGNFQVGKFYPFSILLNLLFIRLYLVNLKFEKTGKSVVAVTFLIIILYFVFAGKP